MSFFYVTGAVVSVALLVYLLLAMLHPEKLQ